MSCHSAVPSFRSNSIPLANQTIVCPTSSLPRRLRCFHSGAPCTLVCPLLSPLSVDSLEFHNMDPVTIPHVNNDPDWVDAPIPIPILVFQTLPSATDRNPINN